MPFFDSALLLTQPHLEKISSSLQELVILIFSPKDSLVFAKALILQQKLYICKCKEEWKSGIEVLAGELVLEGDVGMVSAPSLRAEKLGDEGNELDVAVYGKDLCLADNVVELVVRRIRVDQTWTFSLCL
nr:hypothetical protein CFP56_60049 [Quercus suber]